MNEVPRGLSRWLQDPPTLVGPGQGWVRLGLTIRGTNGGRGY